MLKPLPDILPELATWATVTVHGDCHVQFEKCRYSVPFRLVGRTLWLRASQTTVRIYRDLRMVAVHGRLYKPGSRHTVDDHMPPEAIAYKMRDPQWCLKQAEAVGPACKGLIEALFAHRVLDKLRAAQGVVRLGKTYGPTRLERWETHDGKTLMGRLPACIHCSPRSTIDFSPVPDSQLSQKNQDLCTVVFSLSGQL